MYVYIFLGSFWLSSDFQIIVTSQIVKNPSLYVFSCTYKTNQPYLKNLKFKTKKLILVKKPVTKFVCHYLMIENIRINFESTSTVPFLKTIP